MAALAPRSVLLLGGGTAGDLEPLAVLAEALLLHHNLQPVLALPSEALRFLSPQRRAWLQLTTEPSIAASTAIAATGSSSSSSSSSSADSRPMDTSTSTLSTSSRPLDTISTTASTELLAPPVAVLRLRSPRSPPDADGLTLFQRDCLALATRGRWALVVYNLLALEGDAVAEACGVPSLPLASFWPQRSAPEGFWSAVDDEYGPAARDRLHVQGLAAHVDAWMWRLMLDDVGEARAQLHLPALPLCLQQVLEPTPLLVTSPAPRLPTAVHVLCSPRLPFPRSTAGPDTIRPCGHWLGPFDDASSPSSGVATRHVFVTFGSMLALGLLPKAAFHRLVGCLAEALDNLEMHATVQVGCTAAAHGSARCPWP